MYQLLNNRMIQFICVCVYDKEQEVKEFRLLTHRVTIVIQLLSLSVCLSEQLCWCVL